MKHIRLFKFIILMSFPIAGIVHHLIPIISWLKLQDLLLSCIVLTIYYFGFFIGNQYVLLSKASLSRIAGTFLSAHVISSLIFAIYGYGIFSIFFSLIIGITTGGLLSLPSYTIAKPPINFIISFTPLLGAIIIFHYGFDEILLFSALLAFLFSLLLLFSFKIIVAKPKLIEETNNSLTLEGIFLAFGMGLSGSIINLLIPIIALTIFNSNVIYIGLAITISLIIIQLIGWKISKYDKIHRSLGSFINTSLFFSILLMSFTSDILILLILWTLALIDISFFNSFIIIVNRSIKKFNEYKFITLTSLFSTLGPILSFLLWNCIDYRSIFYLASFLVLINWLIIRKIIRDVE
ncbi:MAG: hypothetical protein QW522_03415 [Candidatus Methanomethyliaceae archaeon]